MMSQWIYENFVVVALALFASADIIRRAANILVKAPVKKIIDQSTVVPARLPVHARTRSLRQNSRSSPVFVEDLWI